MPRISVAPSDPISVLSKAVGRGTRAEQLAAAIDSRIREQNLEPGAPIGTLGIASRRDRICIFDCQRSGSTAS